MTDTSAPDPTPSAVPSAIDGQTYESLYGTVHVAHTRTGSGRILAHCGQEITRTFHPVARFSPLALCERCERHL